MIATPTILYKMESAQKSQEFILLPVAYENWSSLKDDLDVLASKKTKGLDVLEEILCKYDQWENVHVPLGLLRDVLKKGDHGFTEEHFCGVLLPWLAQKALEVNDLFKDHKIRNLYAGQQGKVEYTRRQVCCLLVLAFFNAFEPVQGSYQQFTLAAFFSFTMFASLREKLLCILHYFERIRGAEEAKDEEFLHLCISVERRKLSPGDAEFSAWTECNEPLTQFESLSDDLIEDAHGCLQVDFANEYIGGGVLGMGNLQEEIRFVINPECLISLLFCEKMEELESILITGAEQFSSYKGYGGKFTFTGPYKDTNKVDESKRHSVSIVAIDAIPFMYSSSEVQFQKQSILRELNKAYCGFSHLVTGDDASTGTCVSVATGNWGCGAFGGNKEMKTIIQWLAASRAKRAMKYYTFKDAHLSQRQEKVIAAVNAKKVTVGKLCKVLFINSSKDVFQYIIECMSNTES